MGWGRAGARLARRGAAWLAVASLAGCATVEQSAPLSTIRELTVTPSDPTAGCAAMLWPVDGALSSPFGRREGRAHDGIDLAVAEDTPVRAACDGVVAYAGNGLRGYGNVLILSHSGALATVYAHNRALEVRQGEVVVRGQIIARSGQTGRASAPHLHFEVRKDSIARDPLGYLPAK
ncbi:MAG: peptidoglycan-binding LysM [Myxococcales bacterium]|nr:peptidoglycan-binding LysM [Myxococcales bacterium]